MYILAIETTGFFCSVAVIDEDDKIVHRSSDSTLKRAHPHD